MTFIEEFNRVLELNSQGIANLIVIRCGHYMPHYIISALLYNRKAVQLSTWHAKGVTPPQLHHSCPGAPARRPGTTPAGPRCTLLHCIATQSW